LNGSDGVVAGAEERLARAVFAVLVIACFAAFLLTQRLKHTPTAVQGFELTSSFSPTREGTSFSPTGAGTSFSPTRAGERREERLSFRLAKAGEVTVSIVNANGDEVATLVRNLPVPRYKRLSLRWNGRRGVSRGYRVVTSARGYRSLIPALHGALAPSGEYRVRVDLRGRGAPIYSPRNFTLEGS
jgi:hypothetical protein